MQSRSVKSIIFDSTRRRYDRNHQYRFPKSKQLKLHRSHRWIEIHQQSSKKKIDHLNKFEFAITSLPHTVDPTPKNFHSLAVYLWPLKPHTRSFDDHETKFFSLSMLWWKTTFSVRVTNKTEKKVSFLINLCPPKKRASTKHA